MTVSKAWTDELTILLQSRDLTPHYQPIVNLNTGKVIAHEALIRGPKGWGLEMPNALFQTALEAGRADELELLCRALSVEQFASHKLEGKLFLNVSASLLNSENHAQGFTVDLLNKHGISVDDIVIEISEKHPFDNFGVTQNVVEHYRNMGFKVAIDDLGTGYSGLKLWSELRPDYVKIDKHFIHDIDTDAVKREFVKAISNISQTMGCEVLAEGIETYAELNTIQNIGIPLGQGFFMGRPTAQPQNAYPMDERILNGRLRSWPMAEKRETAASIVTEAPAVNLDQPISVVDHLFHEDSNITAIPVLRGQQPVGVILRHELLELYSTQYGRALYERKPVSNIVNRRVLIVESSLPLDDVSHMVTSDSEQDMLQEIIIVHQGCYVGVGHVRDLLKRITELKVINARHSNPLTLLPGNLPINTKIDELLQQHITFHVAYFDLNNFKPFNDTQGYAKGDRVIRQVADILTRHAGDNGNFVGHIGGDDFVVIFISDDWLERCHHVINEFDEHSRRHYNDQELAQKGVWAVDRKGEPAFFALLGLAVGIVSPDPELVPSHNEVAQLAAIAKKGAKQADHSYIYVHQSRCLTECSELSA